MLNVNQVGGMDAWSHIATEGENFSEISLNSKGTTNFFFFENNNIMSLRYVADTIGNNFYSYGN